MAKQQPRLAALPLGGLGRIGMNMMVYECDGDLIVVDAGVSFPSPADHPGVDIIFADTRYLRDNIKKLKAVFITHAHEDHIGAMGYLWEELDVPVHVSPFAKLVLQGKLKELGYKPGNRLIEVKEGEMYKAGKFEVEYISVTHSIPEAFSLALHTPHGVIVHTGDYKFDPTPVIGTPSNTKRFKELGDAGVLAMFGDSTNVFTKGHAGSEGDLVEKLENAIAACPNRIFISTFASNTGRVLKMIETAAKNGRKTCLLGRTVQNMVGHLKALGYFPGSLTNHIVSPEEAAKLPKNKVMVFASGTQGEGQASLTRLSKGANIKGLKVEAGDTILMSSKMIPGNEKKILDVANAFIELGAHVENEHTADIHVSGHGGQEDMKQMYDLLRPQILVPVHGEAAHMVGQEEWAKKCGVKKVQQVRVGRKVVLAEEGGKEETPYVMHSGFPHGENYVDGYNILDEDAFILKERQQMAYNGLVMVSIPVQKSNKALAGNVAVTSKGLIDPSLQGDLLAEAAEKSTEILKAIFQKGQINNAVRAGEAVSKTVRKLFQQERGKKPVVISQIVEV